MTSETLTDFLPDSKQAYEVLVAHLTASWISGPHVERPDGDHSVEISEQTIPEVEQEMVFLFRDREIVASTPMWRLTRSVKHANRMIREENTSPLASSRLPAVLAGLSEVPSAVDDSAESFSTLLLKRSVGLSRPIRLEMVASGWDSNNCPASTSQRRITHAQYTNASPGLISHIYGRPDWIPPMALFTVVHGGYGDDIVQNWFVVYESGNSEITAALTAHEQAGRGWRGHWTFDADRVRKIIRYLLRHL